MLDACTDSGGKARCPPGFHCSAGYRYLSSPGDASRSSFTHAEPEHRHFHTRVHSPRKQPAPSRLSACIYSLRHILFASWWWHVQHTCTQWHLGSTISVAQHNDNKVIAFGDLISKTDITSLHLFLSLFFILIFTQWTAANPKLIQLQLIEGAWQNSDVQECSFIYLLPQLCVEVVFLKPQRWISLLCWCLSTTWSQSSKTAPCCVFPQSRELCRKILQREGEKWNPRKCCQKNLSSGITRKRLKSRQLLTAQRWDRETPGHLLPSRSGPSSWNTGTQRAVFWTRTLLVTKEPADREGGFKGGNREIGRAKRGPGKDGCQLFLQSLHLRLLGASLPLILPSLPAPQQLLRVYCSRERDLWWFRLRDQCVFSEQSCSLSGLSMNSHYICPTLALPLLSLNLLPNDLVSPHPSFFPFSSVHLGLLLSLWSLWTSLQHQF